MDIITKSEIEAYKLLHDGYYTTENVDYHKEADKIILLAEKIKTERSTCAMLKINK